MRLTALQTEDGQGPDSELVRRARLGDKRAFAAIVSRHGPALYRYAYRLLDEPGSVEDVLQETFIDAWRGLPSFRGESSLRTWLFTLTRHRVSRALRGRPARPPVDVAELRDRLADPLADPVHIQLGAGLLGALDTALRRLPTRQRSAWLLREIEDLSYEEIATVLGETSTVVRGLLERARAALATSLKEWR
ncbi:RNA polymerase sigma factor [Actinoplanes sp. G11-F43]|uniref:RNA polymerase sigma factor n=1 Tax=Actinoplanes sp. G11-F43 TaxID=3424130 RepID=UPI003D33BAB6